MTKKNTEGAVAAEGGDGEAKKKRARSTRRRRNKSLDPVIDGEETKDGDSKP